MNLTYIFTIVNRAGAMSDEQRSKVIKWQTIKPTKIYPTHLYYSLRNGRMAKPDEKHLSIYILAHSEGSKGNVIMRGMQNIISAATNTILEKEHVAGNNEEFLKIKSSKSRLLQWAEDKCGSTDF